jgi:D-proline reductase (dithiol) PrdB
MAVDSFKFLPSSLSRTYKNEKVSNLKHDTYTPISKKLSESRIALITTAGIWNRKTDVYFDYDRERREPVWGDPDFRVIKKGINSNDIGVGHLHINNDDIATDYNIVLPIDRLIESENEGFIGAAAQNHYSFMGYQGFPPDLNAWLQQSAPSVKHKLQKENVDAIVLAPT